MDKKTLNKIRILIAAGLFLLITAAKLLLPSESAEARAWLRREMERGYDYEAAFMHLGERIAEAFGPAEDEGAGESAGGELYSPVTISALRRETRSLLPAGTVPAVRQEGEPQAVTAFLESQSAYSDYDVPEGVSYELPSPPFEFTCPVAGVTSSGFGFRTHPIENKVKFHYGTDFAADAGTDVLAFAYGCVSMVGYDAGGYGNYMIISHGDGWQTLYGHCKKILVSTGDYVYRGQKIALVGSTGEATGPHLHFELRENGVYLNPEFCFAG